MFVLEKLVALLTTVVAINLLGKIILTLQLGYSMVAAIAATIFVVTDAINTSRFAIIGQGSALVLFALVYFVNRLERKKIIKTRNSTTRMGGAAQKWKNSKIPVADLILELSGASPRVEATSPH